MPQFGDVLRDLFTNGLGVIRVADERFLGVPRVTALPTAAAPYRGALARVEGTNDRLALCQAEGGAYVWSTVGGGGLRAANTAAASAIANTTTETAFDVAYTVPANTLAAGDVLRLTAWGTNATHSAGTVTIHIGVRWGGVAGVALASLASMTLATSTSYEWHVEMRAILRSVGASASMSASTRLLVNKNADDSIVGHLASGDITTIDTTADKDLVVTAQHGAANANNTATLHGLVVERLRA